MKLELNLNKTVNYLKISTIALSITTGVLFVSAVNNQNKYLNRDKQAEEIIYQENPKYVNPNSKKMLGYQTGMLGAAILTIASGLAFRTLKNKKNEYNSLEISTK